MFEHSIDLVKNTETLKYIRLVTQRNHVALTVAIVKTTYHEVEVPITLIVKEYMVLITSPFDHNPSNIVHQTIIQRMF